MSLKKTLCLGLLSACISSIALAQPDDYGDGIAAFAPSVLLENKDGRFNLWNGIGRMESRGNRLCTAVLIDTRTDASADQPGSPAYVLSSGHCTFVQPDQMGADLEIEGQVEFNYFKDMPLQRKAYPLKKIHWSTLRGTDIALLELDAPLSRLLQDGITPMKLAQTTPGVGSDVLSVSAPLTATGHTLRLSACTLDAITSIIEHPYAWNANLKNRCEDVLPGSSGSPLIDRKTNTVIGIMGTSTRGATEQGRCFADAPCEVKKNGQAFWSADTNYASPVDTLHACFADGVFNSSLKDCTLKSDAHVTLPNPAYRKNLIRLERDEQGAVIAPRWDMKFTINTTLFKFKTARDPIECLKPEGYLRSRDSRTAHINAVIGTEPGLYSLCIVGHNGNEGDVAGVRENAFIHSVELAEKSVAAAPNVTVERLENGKHRVAFTPNPPVHASHAYKFGTPESTDCANPQGYKTVYYDFNITPKLLPIKLCTLARDESGQISEPRTDLLTELETEG